MERKGSWLIMQTDDPGVFTPPRPGPTSSASDLLIPALAVLVACVLSIIWARATTARNIVLITRTKKMNFPVLVIPDSFLAGRIFALLPGGQNTFLYW